MADASPPSTAARGDEKVMADSGVAATVSVSLHPLVIMNISEHWTRIKAQKGKPEQVFGALIGKQAGRDIEIMNSFELDYNMIEGQVVIDRDYYNLKEEQFKQVFSDMDFLGWYNTGPKPSASDLAVHRQIIEINESPLFLQLSPGGHGHTNTELPISVYESVIDMVAGGMSGASLLLVRLPYSLATEDSERIGLDHVARIVGSEGGPSSTSRTGT